MKKNLCIDCGKRITPYASRCGSCAVKHTNRERGDGTVNVDCQLCGKEFIVGKSRAEAGWGLYCSRKCTDEGKKKRNSVLITCAICGKEFRATKDAAKRGRKYCSRQCSEKSLIKKESRACVQCGTEFQVKPSSSKKLCSRQCYGQWRSEKYRGPANPMWQGGIRIDEYPESFDDALKDMIRDRDGGRCAICGKEQEGRLLSVHHIDYDKDNCHPDNLVSLCNSCHVKTTREREYYSVFLPVLMSCTMSLRA